MKYEKIREIITKEVVEKLYCQEMKSLAVIAKELDISSATLNKLLRDYGLTRDKSIVKSISNSLAKNKYFEGIKSRISRDDIYKYYIIENHSYYNTLDYFNITDWTFNRLLDEYQIKKTGILHVNKVFKLNIKKLEARS